MPDTPPSPPPTNARPVRVDDTFGERHGVPVVRSSIQDVDLGSAQKDPGVFGVAIEDGPDLPVFAHLPQGGELTIVLHGAFRPGVDVYPRFERVRSLLRAGAPFLSFADPTLTVSEELTLAWYVGTEAWSPKAAMRACIDQALSLTGAQDLLFVGGSAGGYASLQLSRSYPGSRAFVFSPQTDITRYRGPSFPRLMQHAFPSTAPEDAKRNHPGVFEVVSAYEQGVDNRTYYLQNITEPHHLAEHYLPFLTAVGAPMAAGDSADGRHRLVLDNLAVEGHGPPNQQEYQHHLERAQKHFASSDSAPVSAPDNRPAGTDIRRELDALGEQVRTISGSLAEHRASTGRMYRALNRELGLMPWNIETYRRIAQRYVPSDGGALPPAGSFAMRTQGVSELLGILRDFKPMQIVECGSGSSTAWMGLALQVAGRGHIHSLEHLEEYRDLTAALLQQLDCEGSATIVHAPVEDRVADDGRATPWYDPAKIDALPESIDLLLVDGPPASLGPRVRRSALEVLWPRLHPGSLVVLDDIARGDETAVMNQWITDYGLERLPGYRDLAVLQVPETTEAQEVS